MGRMKSMAHIQTVADLLAEGHTHLEVRCSCGNALYQPLRVAPWPCGLPVEQLAKRFVCRCGRRQQAVRGCNLVNEATPARYGWSDANIRFAEAANGPDGTVSVTADANPPAITPIPPT